MAGNVGDLSDPVVDHRMEGETMIVTMRSWESEDPECEWVVSARTDDICLNVVRHKAELTPVQAQDFAKALIAAAKWRERQSP